jgi:hypothetical protein
MLIADGACNATSVRCDQEGAMKFKLNEAARVPLMLAAVAVASICLDTAHVDAAPKQKRDDNGSIYSYGPGGPNASYQSGPHTRIYITKRSWLDAGPEVIPGDRKFSDYAFPPGYSFGRENGNRPLDRQPLDPPSDLGGYPQAIPMY